MKLQLNTDSASNDVRSHFGVSGMEASEVHFHRSGLISSVCLNGTVTKRGMPYFAHLCCMVFEAQHDCKLDEDALVGITALRTA